MTMTYHSNKNKSQNLDEPSRFWGKVLYGAAIIALFGLLYIATILLWAVTPDPFYN